MDLKNVSLDHYTFSQTRARQLEFIQIEDSYNIGWNIIIYYSSQYLIANIDIETFSWHEMKKQ